MSSSATELRRSVWKRLRLPGEPTVPGLRITWWSLVRFAVVLLVIVGWFLWLRPSTLGGRAESAIVISDSMEPMLYRGDLALILREDSYHPGDVIVFRVGAAQVIHRIIGGNAADGYITRGDNRDRPDRWRPRPDEIVGRMWLRVPNGGWVILWLRQPFHLAVIAGLSGFLAVMMDAEKRPSDTSRRDSIPSTP